MRNKLTLMFLDLISLEPHKDDNTMTERLFFAF